MNIQKPKTMSIKKPSSSMFAMLGGSLVDIDSIVAVTKKLDERMTRILLSTGDFVYADATPDEIMNAIKEYATNEDTGDTQIGFQ